MDEIADADGESSRPLVVNSALLAEGGRTYLGRSALCPRFRTEARTVIVGSNMRFSWMVMRQSIRFAEHARGGWAEARQEPGTAKPGSANGDATPGSHEPKSGNGCMQTRRPGCVAGRNGDRSPNADYRISS
jgi:hypothetical protein